VASLVLIEIERQTYRPTDAQGDRQTDRQTETDTRRDTDIQILRLTHI